MSPFFLLHNLHFTIEVLGAIAFLTVAWLAFDAFLIRKDFMTASRGIGFGFLAAWQVMHAFQFSSALPLYVSYAAYFVGILFVAANLLMESPVKRPEFKAILILPSAGAVLLPFNTIVTIGLFLITLFSWRQYKRELKKALGPFVIAFLFLSLGALSSLFYAPESLDAFWVVGHVFELIGFFALSFWVWSYLQLRIREEMLLIFVSLTLFMAVMVSLSFSTILINRIEEQKTTSLVTNTRVLDFSISRLQQEALAKTKLIAKNGDIAQALATSDFVKLQSLAGSMLQAENLGFLTILNRDGDVLLRGHAPSRTGENLSLEAGVAAAMLGDSLVDIASSAPEGFSIRASSPVMANGETVGIIVAGFPLDNALADGLKKITGLEMSIFEADTRAATTLFNPDGRTRSVGIKQTDSKVSQSVLQQGNELTLRPLMLSRPYLASYLPILNAANEIVGMVSAAEPQQEVLDIVQTTNRLTLIVVMIIMLIIITPIYLMTRSCF